MPETALVVPIRLDGFLAASPVPCTGPLADFRSLPYVARDDGGRYDRNGDTPWLGSSVTRRPGFGQDDVLGAGTHLHWALPDALMVSRAVPGRDGHRLPPAPDRWLVTRWRDDACERRWLVESDFLWPHDHDFAASALSWDPGHRHPTDLVSYLLPPDLWDESAHAPPWRYVGRALDLDAGDRPDDSAVHLGSLTGTGYGELHFSAHYPSCRSVFGFCDTETTEPAADLRYEVTGFHSNDDHDPLAGAPTAPEAALRLAERYRWSAESPGALPNRTLYAGRISTAACSSPAPPPNEVTVALGDSPRQSVATAVARATCPDDEGRRGRLESLLEQVLADGDPPTGPDADVRTRDRAHRARFEPVVGEPIWDVRTEPVEAPDGAPPGVESLTEAKPPTLSDDVAQALHHLNGAQRELDRARAELRGLRQELHGDWHRLQTVAHPPADLAQEWRDAVGNDPDIIRAWIHDQRILPIARARARAESLRHVRDDRLAEIEALVATQDAATSEHRWRVGPTPGPRYYCPAPPAVSVVGLPATPRHHHDASDGTVSCGVVAIDDAPRDVVTSGAEAVDRLARTVGRTRDAALAGEHPLVRPVAWHPLFLEWQAETATPSTGHAVHHEAEAFAPDLIEGSYRFDDDSVEITAAEDYAVELLHSTTTRGRGVLGRGVAHVLLERLADHLSTAGSHEVPAAAPEEEVVVDDPGDDLALAAQALEFLRAEGAVLTQALAGYDDSLLMRRADVLLPIDDPIGFADEREFATTIVAPALADHHGLDPDPAADFLPIRTGSLGLTELQVVDTWGRAHELPLGDVRVPDRLRGADGRRPLRLAPRLAQESRLSLRWLDAVTDELEITAHPSSSPVCGWLVPDLLDGSIDVRGADGRTRGVISAEGRWRLPPGGAAGILDPVELDNPRLRAVVRWLLDRTPGELAQVVEVFGSGLASIDPDTGDAPTPRALLVARPICVVRIRLDIELRDPPATEQSVVGFARSVSDWFRQDEPAGSPRTRGFEQVRFPIRLGEHRRLGDGVVGFWVEQPDGRLGPTLRMPQSRDDLDPDDHIALWRPDRDHNLWHTLADPPITATVLMDPRGSIHASCGIVPAKAISIPHSQYDAAVRAIGTSFLAAPVLGPSSHVEARVPELPGWAWTWLETDGHRWRRFGAERSIDRSDFEAAFPDRPGLWWSLLDAGWLLAHPEDPDRASIAAPEVRPELPSELVPLRAAVDAAFTSMGRSLAPPPTDARFASRLTLREGWLHLERKDPTR